MEETVEVEVVGRMVEVSVQWLGINGGSVGIDECGGGDGGVVGGDEGVDGDGGGVDGGDEKQIKVAEVVVVMEEEARRSPKRWSRRFSLPLY